MPGPAISCSIQLATYEPLGMGNLPLEGFLPGRYPFQASGLVLPESHPILSSAVEILFRNGLRGKPWRRWKTAIFREERIDLIVHGRSGKSQEKAKGERRGV